MHLRHRCYLLLGFFNFILFTFLYLYLNESIYIESASIYEPIEKPKDFMPDCNDRNYTQASEYKDVGNSFYLGLENRLTCLSKWRGLQLKDSKFVPINKLHDIYAYTAYLDERLEPLTTRILIYKKSASKNDVFCHFFDPYNGHLIHVTKSTKITGTGKGLHMLSGHFDGAWRGYYANCPMPATKVPKPRNACLVGVATKTIPSNLAEFSESEGKLLPLRSTEQTRQTSKVKRALCVRSLFHGENIPPARMIEFLEFTFRLGVDVIVWYIGEIPVRKIHNILQLYRNIPIVNETTGRQLKLEILPWFLPNKDTFAFSQPLMTNDCIFRLMNVANYIQFNDFDEFITPVASLPSMDAAIEKHFKKYNQLSVMCLDNVYFPNSLMSENSPPRADVRLYVEQSQTRCKYSDKLQSKCLVKPRGMLEMLVHKPLLSVGARYSSWGNVGTENLARSHHLRQPPIKYCNIHDPGDLSVDMSMHRFIPPKWRELILKRLQLVLANC